MEPRDTTEPFASYDPIREKAGIILNSVILLWH